MREHLTESKGKVLKRRPSVRGSFLLSASGAGGDSGGGRGRRLSRDRSLSGRSLLSSFAGSDVGGGGPPSLGVEVGAVRARSDRRVVRTRVCNKYIPCFLLYVLVFVFRQKFRQKFFRRVFRFPVFEACLWLWLWFRIE